MKKLISLILLVLLSTSVLGVSMSVVSTINYGDVKKGETYTKDLIYRIYDNEIEEPLELPVIIFSESNLLDFKEDVIGTLNEVENAPITLSVPKKAKAGEYTTKVCAKVLYGNVWRGACADVIYNVIGGKPRGKSNK